jgi:transposase
MGDPIELAIKGPRRRRWSVEEKLRIVEESREPGVSVAAVARRHDLNDNLLYTWRRLAEGRGAPPPSAARLVPVMIAPEPAARARAVSGRIEIGLPDGVSVAIDDGVTPARLAEVLAVLGRSVGRSR